MLEKVRDQTGEFVFLAAVTVFTIVVYYETTSFMQVSATVPQFILVLIMATLILIFMTKFWGDQIKDKLGISNADAGFDLGTDIDDEDNQMSGLYELNTVGVVKEMVWITAYVLGVIYIGFFSITTVFCISYILVKETSSIKRRIPLAVFWTAVIQAMLYLLFVHFLQVSSVWRLGFLP